MVSSKAVNSRLKNKDDTLAYIRTLKEPFSKQEVADHLGFKAPTVGTYFTDFIADDLLIQANNVVRNAVKLYITIEAKPKETTPKELLSRKWI